MQRVMGHIVKQITRHKAGKKAGHNEGQTKEISHQIIEEQPKDNCHRQTENRRHDQTGFFPRLCVMHSVHQEEDSFHVLGRVFGRKMENEAVQ